MQDGCDNKVRDLYRDLLIRCLTNSIYQDPSFSPFTEAKYAQSSRDEGRDWPSIAHTMIGRKRLNQLWTAVETVLEEQIEGDFIETGVWRGGASILMRAALSANNCFDRKVFLADSFSGLPEPEPDKYPADLGDTHYKYPQLKVSREEVERNFSLYGLLDNKVEFVEGLFADTLPGLVTRAFAILRLDGDMYSSTIESLNSLYDSVPRGGFIIVDDFGAVPACRQAVEDFRKERSVTEVIYNIDWTGVYWRKEF